MADLARAGLVADRHHPARLPGKLAAAVLVTNNASDFRRLYAAELLHAGLVIIIATVGRAIQQRLFRVALNELAVIGEPVNRVVEVDLDGEDAVITIYDLPPETPSVL